MGAQGTSPKPYTALRRASSMWRSSSRWVEWASARARAYFGALQSRTVQAPASTVGERSASRVIGLFCLQAVAACASDASTLLRRATVAALNDLLAAEPAVPALQSLWLQCVLPLSLDGDALCVAKAVESFSQTVVQRVIEWHAHALALRKAGAATDASAAASRAALANAATVWLILSAASRHPDLTRCSEAAITVLFRSVSTGGSAPDASKSAAVAAVATSADFDAFVKALRFAADPKVLATADIDGREPAALEQLRSGAWMSLEQVTLSLCGSVADQQQQQARAEEPSDASQQATKSAGGLSSRRRALAAQLMPVVEAAWDAVLPELRVSREDVVPEHSEAVALDEALEDTETASRDAARILRVVVMLAPSMPAASVTFFGKLRSALLSHLCAFAWDAALITEGVKVLAAMPAAASGDGDSAPWAAALLAACEAALTRYLRSPDAEHAARAAHPAVLALFTVGAVALASVDEAAGSRDGAHLAASPLPPHAHVVTLVEALLAPTMLAWQNHDRSGAESSQPSATLAIASNVRAHAYLALGKLCIRDQALAKRYVAVMVRDLQVRPGEHYRVKNCCNTTFAIPHVVFPLLLRDDQPRSGTPAAVRNNILFSLGDLCVRYTAVVDRCE